MLDELWIFGSILSVFGLVLFLLGLWVNKKLEKEQENSSKGTPISV